MHRPTQPRRPFVHHSKRRATPRWLSVPNVMLLAFGAGVCSLYYAAFSSSSSATTTTTTTATTSSDGPGMLAAITSSKKKASGSAPVEMEQDPPFHVVFSTSCSPFQDWQSLLVFLSADRVGQKVGRQADAFVRAERDSIIVHHRTPNPHSQPPIHTYSHAPT